MRLGIKGKQVLGVSAIAGAIVVILSLLHLSTLARVKLEESRARADLLSNAIFQRAQALVADRADTTLMRSDPGLRSILESVLSSKNVTYAAIADVNDVAVVHADALREGQKIPPSENLAGVLSRSPLSELVAIYSGSGRTLEHRQPLFLDSTEFGSIRIGVSTILIRQDLNASLRPAAASAIAALA